MRFFLKVLGWWMLAQSVFAQQKTVDERFFVEKVYPIIEKAECRMCHNDNGVSSATRLKFPPSEAKTEAIVIFGLKLSALVDRTNVGQSLLLNKPTMRIAHTGGERIPKGSAEEETLKTWVAYLAKLTDAQLNASIVRIGSRQHGSAIHRRRSTR